MCRVEMAEWSYAALMLPCVLTVNAHKIRNSDPLMITSMFYIYIPYYFMHLIQKNTLISG